LPGPCTVLLTRASPIPRHAPARRVHGGNRDIWPGAGLPAPAAQSLRASLADRPGRAG